MEQEILKLRGQIRDAEAREAQERGAAEALVASMRSENVDLTVPDNFAKVDQAYKRADGARDEVAALRAQMARLMEIVGQRADERKPSTERTEARTIADRFLRSASYEELKRSGVLSMDGARVHMNPVEVLSRAEHMDLIRHRALLQSTDNNGGGLIWSDRLNQIVNMPQRKVRFLDLVNSGTTETDLVEWMEETVHTDAAAETAYGAVLPEAAYGWTKRSAGVKRVGHWIPALKSTLDDAGRMEAIVNGNLLSGVMRRLERQILAGDGTGENLTGILHLTGIGSVVVADGDNKFDRVHNAITNIRINSEDEIEPNAVGIHPTDYEGLLLARDTQDRYLIANPTANSAPTLWGLTPVVSTAVSVGTVLVGDFNEATLLVRTGVSVLASDQHADFFLRGEVAIKAEGRYGFYVQRPRAFCEVTGF